jgi:hypothetical protein
MSVHIVRYSYQQAFFDTPTVGHFAVAAKDPATSVSAIERQYRGYAVRVEYIATVAR